MKPLEAAHNLTIVKDLIATGQPLPPSLRRWFCGAIERRQKDPHGKNLEQLLGLCNRSGGRLSAHSKTHMLHDAIRNLDLGSGTVTARAKALSDRVLSHHWTPEPELAEIESRYGRIPETPRQLIRILGGKTEATRVHQLLQNQSHATTIWPSPRPC